MTTQSLGNELLGDKTQKLDLHIGIYGCGKHPELVRGLICE